MKSTRTKAKQHKYNKAKKDEVTDINHGFTRKLNQINAMCALIFLIYQQKKKNDKLLKPH